jgi:hypothetical protein
MTSNKSNGGRKCRTPQAAKYLGVSIWKMEDWRRNGGGPPYTRSVVNIITYSKKELEVFRQKIIEEQNAVEFVDVA